MQIRTFLPDTDTHLLQRKRILAQLVLLAGQNKATTQVFDCSEFGLCHLTRARKESVVDYGYDYAWFALHPPKRISKPLILTTVTIVDGMTKSSRERWGFAQSKVGYIYCVSYEKQLFYPEGWRTVEWYKNWGKKTRSKTLDTLLAVPDELVFREAERRLSLRTRKKYGIR